MNDFSFDGSQDLSRRWQLYSNQFVFPAGPVWVIGFNLKKKREGFQLIDNLLWL